LTAKHRTVSLVKRGFDFETFMWYFTRLSALAMYACAIIGLIGGLIMGARLNMNMADLIRWTFMPSPTHVQNTNVPDLAPWSTLFWKIMGSTFIIFATSHGLHGLLSVTEDYYAIPWLRRILRIIVAILTVVMIGIAIYVLWTA
jgi:succinate dehydrogenase hydrophobic anchor subunit